MVDVRVRPPVADDVDRLLADMRPADVAEVTAMSGPDVRHVIERALDVSSHKWAADIDGELMLLAGVAPVSLLGGVGTPWTLGTTLIDAHPGSFVRLGNAYVPTMRAHYPQLVNHVDARNARSIRWLRRMGFTIHPAKPAGVQGLPFHRFDMGF